MKKREIINSIENPDDQLVADAQAGNLDAEEMIIRKYGGLVRNKANLYYMVGSDVDDVIQEGMIGLFKAIHKYKPDRGASFSTFAEICITHQIITAIRSADRNKHKALNTSVSLNKPLKDENDNMTLEDTLEANKADSPEEALIIKDVTYYILNNGDNIFSDFEIQVLNEYLKGYSQEQIARKLGKGVKSIDNAMRRTKKKIIQYMNE